MGFIHMGLLDRAQALLLAVIAIVVAGKQCFTIGNVQPPLVQSDRDPLPRQPPFGVDVKALNAHIAMSIDRALKL